MVSSMSAWIFESHSFETGKVVESGSFSELVTKGGLFAELWQKQIQAEEADEERAKALQAEAEVKEASSAVEPDSKGHP
jgi:hypothetical protein